ncbi:MAG: VTT domain-containing protein [Sulfolobales archaeon]
MVNPVLLIFLVSLISNIIPFASVPYLLLLINLAHRYRDYTSLFSLVLASALGAAVGKMAIYLIGRLMSRAVSENTRENLNYLSQRMRKWGFLAVFIAASTPVPDDLVYMPVSYAGYNALSYFIAVLLGKFILKLATVYLGLSFIELLEGVGVDYILSSVILGVPSLLLIYIISKINWRKALEYYDRRDIRGMLMSIARDTIDSLNILRLLKKYNNKIKTYLRSPR